MGQISRPEKEGGAFSYVAKVALGFTKILAAEADDDLDRIYNEFNGNITAANIADGAIGTTQLTDGAVTTAKLGALAVTTGKIADGAVTTVKIADANVTFAKLAPDTKVVLNTQNFVTGTLALPIGETTLTSFNITSQTGRLTRFTVDWSPYLSFSAGGGGVTLKCRVRVDGVQVALRDRVIVVNAADAVVVPPFAATGLLLTGNHTVTVTIEAAVGFGTPSFNFTAAGGTVYVEEYA